MFNLITSTCRVLKELGLDVHYTESTKSTNLWAKTESFKNTSSLSAYITSNQTAGRGREKNTWLSTSPGDQLFLTLACKLNKSPQPLATAKLGVYIIKSLKCAWPNLKWNLKAPNDIFINDKKVIGILTEVQQQGQQFTCLFGIGINVFSAPDLPTATCLFKEQPHLKQNSWELFLKMFIAQFKSHLDDFCINKFSPEMCKDLLTYLNLHPLLSEKYIGVEARGDLITKNSRTSWQHL